MKNCGRILGLGLALTLALGLTACGGKSAAETMDPTVTVETAAVETGSLSIDGTYIGTVSAEGTVRVIPLVSGTVEEINVAVGDTVSAGDPLCRIDDESAQLTLANARAAVGTAQAAVASAQAGQASADAGRSSADAGVLSAQAGQAQAEAAVQSARESYRSAAAQYGGSEGSDALPVIEEQVRLAEANYENTKALFDIGAAAQVEVEQAYQSMLSAQAGLESAKAGLSSAQAGVAQAEAGLSSAGAGLSSAQAGVQSAQAGARSAEAGVQQALASVEQAKVSVASAEYQLSLYQLTAPISGVVEAVNVTKDNLASSGSVAFIISNGNNKMVTFYVTDEVQRQLKLGQSVAVKARGGDYQGTVTEVSGVVSQGTGLFQVKAVVDSAQNLPDGLTVELTTATQSQENVLLIPSDALYFDNGAPYVYLAKNGAAVRADVAIGVYTTETIAVTAGLAPGDQVITTWSAGLKDGAPIRFAGEGEQK